MPLTNSLVRLRRERLTGFDYKNAKKTHETLHNQSLYCVHLDSLLGWHH